MSLSTIQINGHSLPKSFVAAFKNNRLQRKIGSWALKDSVDSFGNKLETELGCVFLSEKEILLETTNLKSSFQSDGCYGETSEYSGEPGFIPDITDFSDIVVFGISGDGSPFCFDYRNNKNNPEVIWWDDVYWRKVSDTYDEFIELFEIHS